MLDGKALRAAVEKHRPDVIVPEIEAIDTATLAELEAEGWRVAPSAKAVQLTMNRDGIRDFAARELGLATSKYRFAESREEAVAAARRSGCRAWSSRSCRARARARASSRPPRKSARPGIMPSPTCAATGRA